MLEKALAKLYTNYAGVGNGMAQWGLSLLTGMPTSYWSSEDLIKEGGNTKVWEIIMKGTVNNYPMVTGTPF